MAYFGKKKYVAAISCLKKAQYLEPFKWSIVFNLGLVHLSYKQYASAFHYFSASINLKGDNAPAYMYMGIALQRLKDFKNAHQAFERSLEMDK